MEEVTVCYNNGTKAGVYIEFKMPIHAFSIEDMNAYDRFMRENIKRQFGDLMKKYELDFSTDTSYVINDGDKTYLVSCLLGAKSRDLDRELEQMGIPDFTEK